MGLLDLLNFGNGTAIATQDGQPVGLLGDFGQRLSNASPALLGFGMGMLSGANPQAGFASALQGMQNGQVLMRQNRLDQQAMQEKLQRQKAYQSLFANDPRLSRVASADPDLGRQLAADRLKQDDGQIIGSAETGYYRVMRDGSKQTLANPVRAPRIQEFDPDKSYAVVKPDGAVNPVQGLGGLSKTERGAAERARAAEQLGLKPDDPAYRSYVLTGRMPREDAQPLSATDKKAIMEADDGALAAQTAIQSLERAKQLSSSAYEGPMASERGYVTSLFGSDAGSATNQLNNEVTTNALSQLKAIFGAAPTEGERKILLDIQGSARLPHADRAKIYERAQALAQRRLELNKQRADELRGGSFYKPGGGGSAVRQPSGLQPGQAMQHPSGVTIQRVD